MESRAGLGTARGDGETGVEMTRSVDVKKGLAVKKNLAMKKQGGENSRW